MKSLEFSRKISRIARFKQGGIHPLNWKNITLNLALISKGEISISEVIEHARSNPSFSKAGGIGIFIGVVRGENNRGESVEKLELEAYEEKADEVLGKICRELKEKPGVIDARIHHFVGEFEVSEDLVYVVVIGAHRKNIFPVLEEAVERYKSEAPIFKKEYVLSENGRTESYWIGRHETNSTEK